LKRSRRNSFATLERPLDIKLIGKKAVSRWSHKGRETFEFIRGGMAMTSESLPSRFYRLCTSPASGGWREVCVSHYLDEEEPIFFSIGTLVRLAVFKEYGRMSSFMLEQLEEKASQSR